MQREPTDIAVNATSGSTAAAPTRSRLESPDHNRHRPLAPRTGALSPVVARGKVFFTGGEKLRLRGATYGSSCPPRHGTGFFAPALVERDLARMASAGLNTLRTYVMPPPWLLDAAAHHALRLLVGIPLGRHGGRVTGRDAAEAARLVRESVATCAAHPAVMGYAIGSGIPAPLVRWHGRRTIERLLERLYLSAKAVEPSALVTCAYHPSTDYLQVPLLDFLWVDAPGESPTTLASTVARLHHIAGDRPLVLGEIGADGWGTNRHGRAHALAREIREGYVEGCAGIFLATRTDRWRRAEVGARHPPVRSRPHHRWRPPPAAVCEAFADPLSRRSATMAWPRISVVVCTRDGSRTIAECLEEVRRLAYPEYEVIVVDDGSADGTADIVRRLDVRLIRTPHRGLSSARNTGWRAATGEIVAYLDDDAYPDPDWLTHLALRFSRSDHVGVGGPNVAPPGDGPIAACVDRAPGNPVHVMLSDREADHLPGCNMAFRRGALEAVGGFDERFQTAGDDVDICWRLRARGWTLGFSAGAVVWHHRRNSLRAYWNQQVGYGRAEGLLEQKWPERYAPGGDVWTGRVYGTARSASALLPVQARHIYQGRPHTSGPRPAGALALSPQWMLLVAALASLTALGVAWPPLLAAAPLLLLAALPLVARAVSAARASGTRNATAPGRWQRLVIGWLHVLQPVARLYGRLTPPHPRPPRSVWPWPRATSRWCEDWEEPAQRLQHFEAAVRACGLPVLRGGAFDRWDLEVRGGFLGAARVLMAVEEHAGGRQLVRLRRWPRPAPALVILAPTVAGLGVLAVRAGARLPGLALGAAALWAAGHAVFHCAAACGAISRAAGLATGPAPREAP